MADSVRFWGWYSEAGLGLGNGQMLSALADDLQTAADDHEADILRYLLSASKLMSLRQTIVTDPLAEGVAPQRGPDMMTDGVWVWPSAIAYFVRTYHLAVPDEFVAHMRDRSWVPPKPNREQVTAIMQALGAQPMQEPSDEELAKLLQIRDAGGGQA